MQYRYTHSQTTATTGFFTCLPPEDMSLEDALAYLEQSPNDSFMRRHLLNALLRLPKEDAQKLLIKAESSPVRRSLLAELNIFAPDDMTARNCSPRAELQEAAQFSPLVYAHAARRPDQALQEAWRALFTANLTGHRKLPPPQENPLPPLYVVASSSESEGGDGGTVHWSVAPKATLPELHARFAAQAGQGHASRTHQAHRALKIPQIPCPRPSAEETAGRALERLSASGIIAGAEMRHQSSLSPIALQRSWRISLKVEHGRHNYTLEGQADTYGRGLSLPAARASCLMEMVERASAYASVSPQGLPHKKGPSEILFARRSELLAWGHDVIDIAAFHTDRPYKDEPLHFIWGLRPAKEQGQPNRPALVPMQMAYLFSNLDEPDLSDAPGSTGLAAGNTMEEAKAAALIELLERDAEATNIYHKSRCFTLQAEDPEIKRLLEAYAAQGVNVQFQDLTSSLGLPCVKCFVIGAKGQIHRATGAGLDAKRAIISALTETPFPFPHGPSSGPQLRNLPVVSYESLPAYALESPARNLALLEELFRANGFEPVYVDLSRSDLDLPVVRALAPGLHGGAELDSSTPAPKRLYEHYLRVHGG